MEESSFTVQAEQGEVCQFKKKKRMKNNLSHYNT